MLTKMTLKFKFVVQTAFTPKSPQLRKIMVTVVTVKVMVTVTVRVAVTVTVVYFVLI